MWLSLGRFPQTMYWILSEQTKAISSTTCNELQGGRQLTDLNVCLIIVNDIQILKWRAHTNKDLRMHFFFFFLNGNYFFSGVVGFFLSFLHAVILSVLFYLITNVIIN